MPTSLHANFVSSIAHARLRTLVSLLACDFALGCAGSPPASEQDESASNAARQAAPAPVATDDRSGPVTVSVRLNRAPVIRNMAVTPSPLIVNAEARLFAAASDADGDALSYAWSSDCNGRFVGEGAGPLFTLATRPDSGFCTMQVIARDDTGAAGQGDLTVSVGTPVVVETGAPVIGIVFQSAESVKTGETATFGIEATASAGPLVYEWKASDGLLRNQQDNQPQGDIPGKSRIDWTAPAQIGPIWEVTAIVRDAVGTKASYVFGDLCMQQ